MGAGRRSAPLPPELDDARAEEEAGEARQRERLWYVACTRARDLMIVPHLPAAENTSWSRVVNLGHAHLPELDQTRLPPAAAAPVANVRNEQTRERFDAEALKVRNAVPPLDWRRPSDHDPDRSQIAEGPISDFNETAEVTTPKELEKAAD